MTELSDQEFEAMIHLALQRCMMSLQSVLEEMPDAWQRVVMATSVGSMMLAVATQMTMEHYRSDTEKDIPFDVALTTVASRMLDSSMELGEHHATKALAQMRARSLN